MPTPLRVLILEDRPTDAELILHELRRAGFDPEWQRVETEEEYLAALHPALDIIISDYKLPQFDGLGAVRLLRARGLDLPFILVSGTIGEEVAVECIKQGAADYLLKDRLTRLGPAVKSALEQKRLRDERKLAEAALWETESQLHTVLNNAPITIFVTDSHGIFTLSEGKGLEHVGLKPGENVGVSALDLYGSLPFVEYSGKVTTGEDVICRVLAGEEVTAVTELRGVYFDNHIGPLRSMDGKLVGIVGIAIDITERKQAELRNQYLTRLYATLSQVNQIIVRVKDQSELLQAICRVVMDYGKLGLAWIGLVEGGTGQVTPIAVQGTAQAHLPFQTININEAPFRDGLMGTAVKTGQIAYSRDIQTDPTMRHWHETAVAGGFHSAAAIPFRLNGEIFGLLNLYATDIDFFTVEEEQNLVEEMGLDISFALDNIELAARRKQADEALRLSYDRFNRLVSQLNDVVWNVSLDGSNILDVNKAFEKVYGRSTSDFLSNPRLWIEMVHPEDRKIAEASSEELFKTGMTTAEYRIVRPDGTFRWMLDRKSLLYDETGVPIEMGGIANDITERKQAEEDIRRQVKRLAALRTIDQAIAYSTDVNFVFKIILDHVISQLNVDAAVILLYNPATQALEYTTGRGFRTTALQDTRLPLGEGYAGRAALARQMVHIPNLQGRMTDFLHSPTFSQERFVSYFGVPLIAKGEIKGVLEVFHRAAFEAETEWLNFLETLAGQTAIAIDNATLFKGLQLSNIELTMAYDATIEGWSQAMDLRDKETEGHTQRVTEMSQRLARVMRVNEAELVNMRRGALLHDIGKMGVPDAILLKAGQLTDKEWVVMKQHPQFAYNMLSSIAYLRPALDIPYCHHEKWDGTGYPRGLKGQEIPLSARIFAVIDVWDALTSDRPYRAAWPREKVTAYIQELSGTHFDPAAVDAFIEMLRTE